MASLTALQFILGKKTWPHVSLLSCGCFTVVAWYHQVLGVHNMCGLVWVQEQYLRLGMVAHTYKPSFWKDLNVETSMDSISKYHKMSEVCYLRDCVVQFVLVFLCGKRGPRQQHHLITQEPVHVPLGLVWREGFPQWAPSCVLVSEVFQSIGLSQCCPFLLGWTLV